MCARNFLVRGGPESLNESTKETHRAMKESSCKVRRSAEP